MPLKYEAQLKTIDGPSVIVYYNDINLKKTDVIETSICHHSFRRTSG